MEKTIEDCFFSNDDFQKPSSSVVKLEVKIARNFFGVGIGFIFTGQILVFLNVINRNSIWNISALFNCIGMMFISLGTMKRFRKFFFLILRKIYLIKKKDLNFLSRNLSRQSVLYQIKINFWLICLLTRQHLVRHRLQLRQQQKLYGGPQISSMKMNHLN